MPIQRINFTNIAKQSVIARSQGEAKIVKVKVLPAEEPAKKVKQVLQSGKGGAQHVQYTDGTTGTIGEKPPAPPVLGVTLIIGERGTAKGAETNPSEPTQ